MPIYGRSFDLQIALEGPLLAFELTREAGAYDYKALSLSGAVEHYDNSTRSSYIYDPTKKELISYDNTAISRQKADRIQEMNLGGDMDRRAVPMV